MKLYPDISFCSVDLKGRRPKGSYAMGIVFNGAILGSILSSLFLQASWQVITSVIAGFFVVGGTSFLLHWRSCQKAHWAIIRVEDRKVSVHYLKHFDSEDYPTDFKMQDPVVKLCVIAIHLGDPSRSQLYLKGRWLKIAPGKLGIRILDTRCFLLTDQKGKALALTLDQFLTIINSAGWDSGWRANDGGWSMFFESEYFLHLSLCASAAELHQEVSASRNRLQVQGIITLDRIINMIRASSRFGKSDEGQEIRLFATESLINYFLPELDPRREFLERQVSAEKETLERKRKDRAARKAAATRVAPVPAPTSSS